MGRSLSFLSPCLCLERDSARGTCVCACAALSALIGINGVDVTLRNCTNRAFVNTCAASNAIFANLVSHSVFVYEVYTNVFC